MFKCLNDFFTFSVVSHFGSLVFRTHQMKIKKTNKQTTITKKALAAKNALAVGVPALFYVSVGGNLEKKTLIQKIKL